MQIDCLQKISTMAETAAKASVFGIEDNPVYVKFMEQQDITPEEVERDIYKNFHAGMSDAFRNTVNSFYISFLQNQDQIDLGIMELMMEKAKRAALVMLVDMYQQTHQNLVTDTRVKDDTIQGAFAQIHKRKVTQAKAAAEQGPSPSRIIR